MQRIDIPRDRQPFRRQSSLGGNVSFRNLGNNEDNTFITMAKVTKVYYKTGRVDFKLNNTNNVVQEVSGSNGIGSAPIPVDFYGRKADGTVFGHYRPIKIGDTVAIAYVGGHRSHPIVLGVYPDTASGYEVISPSIYRDGDDNDSGVAENGLAERKLHPSMQIDYRSGTGTIAHALNGHSYLAISSKDNKDYSQLWNNYKYSGFFNADGKIVNPLQEKAGEWLLVHEDNPKADDADDHRTRFYVNEKGEFQIVAMSNTSRGRVLALNGSKDNGFTVTQYYETEPTHNGNLGVPTYNPDLDNAPRYVKFDLGNDQSINLESASKYDSIKQYSKLSVRDDGVYINDKMLVPSNEKWTGKTIIDQAVEDSESLNDAIQAAKGASMDAQKAGERASQVSDQVQQGLAAMHARLQRQMQDMNDQIKQTQDDFNKSLNDTSSDLTNNFNDSLEKERTERGVAIAQTRSDLAKMMSETATDISDNVQQNLDYQKNHLATELSQSKDNQKTGRLDNNKSGLWGKILDGVSLTGDTYAFCLWADTINAGTLNGTNLTFKNITFTNEAGNHIEASTIDSGTLNTVVIRAGSISAQKINSPELSDISKRLGEIKAGSIQIGKIDKKTGKAFDPTTSQTFDTKVQFKSVYTRQNPVNYTAIPSAYWKNAAGHTVSVNAVLTIENYIKQALVLQPDDLECGIRIILQLDPNAGKDNNSSTAKTTDDKTADKTADKDKKPQEPTSKVQDIVYDTRDLYNYETLTDHLSGSIDVPKNCIGGTVTLYGNLHAGLVSFDSITLSYNNPAYEAADDAFAVDSKGNVTANSINVNNGTIKGGTISAKTAISGATITGTTIEGNTITGGSISGTTITGTTIKGNTISGGTISGTSISGTSINGSIIGGTDINGGTITGSVFDTTANISGKTQEFKITGNQIFWRNTGGSEGLSTKSYTYLGLNSFSKAGGQVVVGSSWEQNLFGLTDGGERTDFTIIANGGIGIYNSDESGRGDVNYYISEPFFTLNSNEITLGTQNNKLVIGKGGDYGVGDSDSPDFKPHDLNSTGFIGALGDKGIEFDIKPNYAGDTSNNAGSSGYLAGANFVVQMDNEIGIYAKSDDTGLEINALGGVNIGLGDLNVKGNKHSVIDTTEGETALTVYELAGNYFGDLGESSTDSNGTKVIGIDKIFGQTVNTNVDYNVFVSAYQKGQVWVEKRTPTYFIVKSEYPNEDFSWEIKAHRKNYEHDRLGIVDNNQELPAVRKQRFHGNLRSQQIAEEAMKEQKQ